MKIDLRIIELVKLLWKYNYSWLLVGLVLLLLTPIFLPKELVLFIFYCLPIHLFFRRKLVNIYKLKQNIKNKSNIFYCIFFGLPTIFYTIYLFGQQEFFLVIASLLNSILLIECIIKYTYKLIEQKQEEDIEYLENVVIYNNSYDSLEGRIVAQLRFYWQKIISELRNQRKKDYNDIIFGGIAIYLLFGISWFFIYLIIGLSQEAAFCISLNACTPINIDFSEEPFDLLYFSFKTLTTIGYGDIYPVNIAAKIFSNLEGIVGVMFPAVFIARLVGNFQNI